MTSGLPRKDVWAGPGRSGLVDLVAYAPFGGVIGRPVDAKHPRELVWLPSESASTASVFVCGPSFLSLVESFPDGDLPIETAAAIHALLKPPERLLPTLHALRFDVDERVFRWSRASHRSPSTGGISLTTWREEMSARLIGHRRPLFDRVYSPRRWAQFALSPPAADVDVDVGVRHLAGLVEATLADKLRAAREQREQWWLHDGNALLGEPADDSVVKGTASFGLVDVELAAGHTGAARMNIKLAAMYDPQRPRYRRVLELLEG